MCCRSLSLFPLSHCLCRDLQHPFPFCIPSQVCLLTRGEEYPQLLHGGTYVPAVGRRMLSHLPTHTTSPPSWGAMCQIRRHPAPSQWQAEQSLGALQRTWPSLLDQEAMTPPTSRLIPTNPPVILCLAGPRISKVRRG